MKTWDRVCPVLGIVSWIVIITGFVPGLGFRTRCLTGLTCASAAHGTQWMCSKGASKSTAGQLAAVLDRLALSIRSQDKRIHRRQEIRSLERLADNGIGLRGNLRRVRICAEDEDRHKSCSTVGTHVLDQLLSSHDRHHQIGHHQIGQGIAHLSDRVAAVSSLGHLVAAILQNQPQ